MRKLATLALAATMSASLGLAGLAPSASAANLTPEQVAGYNPNVSVEKMTSKPGNSSQETWRHEIRKEDSVYFGKVDEYLVHSPSMNVKIPVAVIPARDGQGNEIENAPTIYALNGAGGAEQGLDWLTASDSLKFYFDKGVNVVIPQSGAFSYYIDWYRDPQGAAYNLSRHPQKWETFLTKELPGAIENELNASNKRAILGYSMAATPALLLAEKAQGFYDAVGSFSGCASTAAPHGYGSAAITINRANAKIEDLFGPMNSPHNRANDALINAEKLRGTEIYVSNGSGTPGATDTFLGRLDRIPANADQDIAPLAAAIGSANVQFVGGAIEATTNYCTHELDSKLRSLNIPAEFNFRNQGTHDWPYWEQDIKDSWPTFKRAFEK